MNFKEKLQKLRRLAPLNYNLTPLSVKTGTSNENDRAQPFLRKPIKSRDPNLSPACHTFPSKPTSPGVYHREGGKRFRTYFGSTVSR